MITWYSLVHIEAVPLRDRSLKVEAIVLPSTLAHGALGAAKNRGTPTWD